MPNILVRRMVEQIERDYAQSITLRTMSATVGRQPAYMGRLFQQEVGSSVREYLTRVRLEHAADLIRDGVKIEAVALSVGYRSKKNFYHRFKGYYGTTPVRYRIGSAPAVVQLASSSPADPLAVAIVPTVTPSPSEPIVHGLASIVRASNKAWRLAAQAQRIILQHFTRLRLGVLLTNEAGRYASANRAALSMTGYSMMELCNRSPSELFVSAANLEMRCVWQLLLPRSIEASNAQVRSKSGDLVPVHLVTLKNVLWGVGEMSAILDSSQTRLAG